MRAQDALPPGLFKENDAKIRLRTEPPPALPRPSYCMKRTLLLCAVLFGAAWASQAGVRAGIGIGIPLSGVVISQPPRVVVASAPVYAQPPAVVVAPPVVVAPYPGYYAWSPGWYGYGGWGPYHGWGGYRGGHHR